MKQYRKDNHDKLIEYKKANRKNTREYNKQYYENNYESLREKRCEKMKCECGCDVNIYNLSRHKQTKKHINLMENLNINPNEGVDV